MPIRFEQPSPQAPELTASASRAQVASHDFPSIVAMYEAANRNKLAASQAQASLGLQASAATAHNMQQAEMAGAAMEAQQRQYAASLYPSQRDQFIAQQRQQEQQERFQEQQWLMQQDLSQKEMMQLQTAQAGLATVMGDPGVSDAEKQEAMQLYQQHINPLKVRQQRMQQKFEQQQLEQAIRTGTMQAVMENGTQDQRTKAMMQRIVNLPDQNGDPHQFYVDHKGDLQAVPHDKLRTDPAEKEAQFTVHDYLKLHKELYDEALKAYPPMTKNEAGDTVMNEANLSKHAEYVQNRLKGLGLPGTPEEFVQTRQAARQGGRGGAPPTIGGSTLPAGPVVPPTVPTAQAAPPLPKFTSDDQKKLDLVNAAIAKAERAARDTITQQREQYVRGERTGPIPGGATEPSIGQIKRTIRNLGHLIRREPQEPAED